MSVRLTDVRCTTCGKLLARAIGLTLGTIELNCRGCRRDLYITVDTNQPSPVTVGQRPSGPKRPVPVPLDTKRPVP